MFCRNLCVGWAWSPAQEFCALASLGSHGSWAVDWLISFVLSTLGLSGDGTQPSRAPLSDATSLKLERREILLSFFFFELELSVISTQSQGRGPLRKINLSAFLLASLWLWLPGYLHDSFPPVLSLFPKTPELSPVSRWGFDRVSSCVKKREGAGRGLCRLESLRNMPPREVAGELAWTHYWTRSGSLQSPLVNDIWY